ncbi:MAG: hypothetical protein JNM99_15200 [Verrucomicrobiaceae bacterium]|nr:hypothetical protein [Verrucomicrobiaceae bacterium]
MMDDADIRSLGLDDLREAVRAAASAYQSDSFVIVGRASLAATLPDCDPELRATMDVDLFPPWDETNAAKWAAADVHVGRVSDFRRQHGFYIERVAEWTVKLLPESWEDRAARFEVDGIRVLAIHPLDLIYTKLQAARQKDLLFVKSAIELGLISITEIETFVAEKTTDHQSAAALLQQLEAAKTFEEDDDQ